MLTWRPFHPDHLKGLALQAAQADLQKLAAAADVAAAAVKGLAYTAFDGETVLGSGGVFPTGDDNALCWVLAGRDVPSRYWTAVVRKAWVVLARAHDRGLARLHATVDCDFEAGHKLVRLVGFRPVEILHAYGPAERDHVLYEKVKP